METEIQLQFQTNVQKTMKLRYLKYSIYVLCALVMIACTKDKGNYDYQDINSVEINGIEDHYLIEFGSTPNISPTLEFSKDPNFNEENYSFEWISFNQGEVHLSTARKLLHTGKDFDIPLALSLGKDTLYYRVKEKSTGILWTRKFEIEVTGSIKGGWAVLSEVDNNSQLDYFEYDLETNSHPKEYRDFASYFIDSETGAQLTLEGKPKFIEGWVNTTAATGTNRYLLYVGTDKKTEKINVTAGFQWSERFNFSFETLNNMELPRLDRIYPIAASQGYGMYNGVLHKRVNVSNINFGNPANLLNGELVELAPFIAVNRMQITGNVALVYDKKNKRFLRCTATNTALTGSLSMTGAAFNPNNVGMDLVWMGSTNINNGSAYAVLTKDGKFHLARMTNNITTFEARYLDDISSLPGIAQAKHFEVDQIYGYLQYAVGGKLYQYDVDTKETKLMKDFGNREITMLKHNKGNYVSYTTAINPAQADKAGRRFLPVIKAIIVATYDPTNPKTSGQVDFFEAPQFNMEYTTYYSFSGLGKVQDVACIEFPTGY